MKKQLVIFLSGLTLSSCMHTDRYQLKNDEAPLRTPTSLETQNAIPKYEDIYPWSVKPYSIQGVRYQPMSSAKNYSATGIASWYGRKFHGHLTANGETYDMFAMSAAHKTLPIPSYLKVTNLDNQKSIIVRVNDRGPFHANRIIDLSYSAAYAIDMLEKGTAKVFIEAIEVTQDRSSPMMMATTVPQTGSTDSVPEQSTLTKKNNQHANELNVQLFVQVMTSVDGIGLLSKAQQLAEQYQQLFHIEFEQGKYQLHLGPLDNEVEAAKLEKDLKNNGYTDSYILYTQKPLPDN